MVLILGIAPALASAAEITNSTFVERLDAEIAETGLTSYDVAARASATSPQLEVQRQHLLEAAHRVDQALAAFMPNLTLRASYTRLSDSGNQALGNIVVAPGVPAGPVPAGTQLVSVPLEVESISNQYALEANLLVPVSDYFVRIAPAHSAAKANHGATDATLRAKQAQVAADARIAYYTWVRARLSVVVADQALELSKGHLADAEQGYLAGTASRADVLRVESQLASSEEYLTQSQDMSAIAEENLRILIQAPPGEVFRIGEDIRRSLPRAPQRSASDLVTEALSRRPELRAYDLAEQAEQDRADLERAGALPRFDLFASAAYANPNPAVFPPQEEFRGSWATGAQLSWTISDVPSALAASRAVQARSESLGSERRALADRIRSEVFSARRILLQELGSVKTAARRLAAAEESYRVRRLLFQAGKATSVELMDAEVELTRARLEALNGRVDCRVAAVRLDYALGRNPSRAAPTGK